MNLKNPEQEILNAIYGGVAWLLLDFGLLFQEHGSQTLTILVSQPEMAVGAIIAIASIVGLIYKSRLAAITLFLLFLLPLVLRAVQGDFPSTMILLFFLILLYIFLTAVIGTFRYHHLKTLDQEANNQS